VAHFQSVVYSYACGVAVEGLSEANDLARLRQRGVIL
jgi:hypothetical protein